MNPLLAINIFLAGFVSLAVVINILLDNYQSAIFGSFVVLLNLSVLFLEEKPDDK